MSEYSKVNLIDMESGKSNDIVNILHISDLHFGIEKSVQGEEQINVKRRHTQALKSLIETLIDTEKVPSNWKPDIVVISGDIAWWGEKEEYSSFKNEFLNKLLLQLEIIKKEGDKTDRVIICPGNHDIIRSRVISKYTGPVPRPFKGKKSNRIDIPDITLESAKEERWKHFENYVTELEQYFPDGEAKYLSWIRTIDQWPWLYFIALNSAWDCRNDKDEGRLRVGRSIAEKLMGDIRECGKKRIVSVFHHPLFPVSDYSPSGSCIMPIWLHKYELNGEFRNSPCFQDILDGIATLILCGHVHKFDDDPKNGQKSTIPFVRTTQFVSGTSYSTDTFQYHCRIIKLHKNGTTAYRDLNSTATATIGGIDWVVSSPHHISQGSEYDRLKESLAPEIISLLKNLIIDSSNNPTPELINAISKFINQDNIKYLQDYTLQNYTKKFERGN